PHWYSHSYLFRGPSGRKASPRSSPRSLVQLTSSSTQLPSFSIVPTLFVGKRNAMRRMTNNHFIVSIRSIRFDSLKEIVRERFRQRQEQYENATVMAAGSGK